MAALREKIKAGARVRTAQRTIAELEWSELKAELDRLGYVTSQLPNDPDEAQKFLRAWRRELGKVRE